MRNSDIYCVIELDLDQIHKQPRQISRILHNFDRDDALLV
jgi:hypothetical protein